LPHDNLPGAGRIHSCREYILLNKATRWPVNLPYDSDRHDGDDSAEEAVGWAKHCPAADGDVIEVRKVFESADFPQDVRNAAVSFP